MLSYSPALRNQDFILRNWIFCFRLNMRKKSKIPGGSDKNYEKDKGEFLQKLQEFLQAKGYVQFDFKVELETQLVTDKLWAA